MRILLISQFFAPDITAAAFRMADFAALLAKNGHEVRVITSYPYKAQVSLNDDELANRGIEVQRCHVREVVGTGARPYLKHYLSFVRGSISLGLKLWRQGWKPDVIYVSSPPLFIGISGRLLSIIFRRPLVFEVRDIWPDTAVAAGQLSGDGRAYRLGRKMERYFYRKADHIVCVSKKMAEYIQSQTSTAVSVAYNGVPAEAIDQSDGTPPVPNSRPFILYTGNLGHLQELDLLIKGFVQIKNQPSLRGWHLSLVGNGAQLDPLKTLVDELGANNDVTFREAVSRDEAMQMMRTADLLYLNLKQDDVLSKTIPSKLFDYLLAQRPIVAGLGGEGRELLRSTGANVVFSPGNLEELKNALCNAVDRITELSQKAIDNRTLVTQRFTREQAVAVLESVFESVIR